MNIRLATLLVLAVAAVVISACGTAPDSAPQGEARSALTHEEAARIIDTALRALNTGDYEVWSRDWDEAMKAAIQESDFKQYRDQVAAQYGQYVELESLEMLPGQQEGNVRWVAVANFENGRIKFTFGFQNDGRQIKGIFPEAVE